MSILPDGETPGLIVGLMLASLMLLCVASLVWVVRDLLTTSVWFRGWRAREQCQACAGVPVVLLTGSAAEPALNYRYGDVVVNAGGMCPRHTKLSDHIAAMERELLP